MATKSQDEVIEESDKETIQKVYGKYVETYGRKPRFADHFRNFSSKFDDVHLSLATANHFVKEVKESLDSSTDSSSSSLFVPPKLPVLSSISTPNVLTTANRVKRSKLRNSLNPTYSPLSDIELLKSIKSTIVNLEGIKDNHKILEQLNNVLFNNDRSKYNELSKRLARKVRFAPSTVRHNKDETFLSLKKMSEATDISDTDHDTSVYLLRNFFDKDGNNEDDEVDELQEESLSLYDSMVIKYQKSRRNILSIDNNPPSIEARQQSAPAVKRKQLKPAKAQAKRLSLTLNESIQPNFQCDMLMDGIFRQFSTASDATSVASFSVTELNEEKSKEDVVIESPNAGVQPNILAALMKYDDKMERWDFDVFEFMDDPVFDNRGLVYLSFYLFRKTGLLDSTEVSQAHLWRFLEEVNSGYLDNAYHNKYHAVDVILNTHYFFQCEFMQNHMTQWDRFAAYIAAVCHDLGHMGFSNGWYVNTAGTLALLYGDQSVLENYHVNETFRLLAKEDCNWMSNFTSSCRKYLSAVIKECILATDVKHHGTQMHQLTQMIEAFSVEKDNEGFDNFNHIQLQKFQSAEEYASLEKIRQKGYRLFMDDEREKEYDGDTIIYDVDVDIILNDDDEKNENTATKARVEGIADERLFILGITIHCCDVANPCKPIHLCKQWAQNYLYEALNQGDREKALGLPASPGMDRNTIKLPNSQLGFIQFIVKKLFQKFSQLLGSKEAEQCLDIMLKNEQYWLEAKKEQTTYKIAKKPGLVTITETP